jgi:hypothetical protein
MRADALRLSDSYADPGSRRLPPFGEQRAASRCCRSGSRFHEDPGVRRRRNQRGRRKRREQRAGQHRRVAEREQRLRRCGRSRRSDQTRGRRLLDASCPGATAALSLVASVIRVVGAAQRDAAARQARVVSARRPRLAALDRRRGLACRREPDQEPGRRFGHDGGRERPPLQARRGAPRRRRTARRACRLAEAAAAPGRAERNTARTDAPAPPHAAARSRRPQTARHAGAPPRRKTSPKT